LEKMTTFAERIEGEDERFVDSWVDSHGFTPYNRDYDVVITTVAALPPEVPIGDTAGSYLEGRYRLPLHLLHGGRRGHGSARRDVAGIVR
jgi:hypothetical protein